MFPVLVKKVSGCGCDAVDLGEGTDSEKTDTGAEEGENLAQPAPVFAHTIFNVIERSAKYMAAFINGAVLDGQYSAPAPPATSAVATPTILPVPMVADRAVQRAAKLLTSPWPSFSFWNMYLQAMPSLWNWIPRRRMVKKIPVARIRTIRGTPHTKPSSQFRNALTLLNIILTLSPMGVFI